MSGDLDDFNFILNRSETIVNTKYINNPVKEINFTYSSESEYSDEILCFLTQTIDKINQYKYKQSLINQNSNNNFRIYNLNYISNIDAFYQYESIKKEIYSNEKAFNVHEHRKIPYEDEHNQNRQNHRRFIHHKFNNNIRNKGRSASTDYLYHKESNSDNEVKYIDDKVMIGGNEFKNNYKRNNIGIKEKIDNNKSTDNINVGRTHMKNKNKTNKLYYGGLTTYDPFYKAKKKEFKEDNNYD